MLLSLTHDGDYAMAQAVLVDEEGGSAVPGALHVDEAAR
jgi:hypothetical protein